MSKLRVLDLFSGIGGFSLGLERTGGFETVAFCEIESYPQKLLAKRWPGVKIYDDIRQLTAGRLAGDGIGVDVITAGFPCQDLSVCGVGQGFEGKRSSLYREVIRIIGECKPRYAIFENVTGLLTGDRGRWFSQFLNDLARVGYDAQWSCIRASQLGARHLRDRVYILAYPGSQRLSRRDKKSGEINGEVGASERGKAGRETVSVSYGGESPRIRMPEPVLSGRPGKLESEPFIHRRNDDVSGWSHQVKGLGNAVVPAVIELIGNAIMEVVE